MDTFGHVGKRHQTGVFLCLFNLSFRWNSFPFFQSGEITAYSKSSKGSSMRLVLDRHTDVNSIRGEEVDNKNADFNVPELQTHFAVQ